MTLRKQALRSKILAYLRTDTSVELCLPKRFKAEDSTGSGIITDKLIDLTGDTSNGDIDDICIVPTQWLAEWLSEPQLPPPQLYYPPRNLEIFIQARAYIDPETFFCPHYHISPENRLLRIRAISRSGLTRCFNLTEEVEDATPPSPFTSVEASTALSPCMECLQLRVSLNRFNIECNNLVKSINQWKKISRGGSWPLTPLAEAIAREGQIFVFSTIFLLTRSAEIIIKYHFLGSQIPPLWLEFILWVRGPLQIGEHTD